jgi:hypothetical protein|mmetsp:Transcript_14078/g.13589  ORF Transcript_14078/g.13589 Transcript_14078/m.13589 type:complete len:251 (-) Transcript_14078:516-1268(-)
MKFGLIFILFLLADASITEGVHNATQDEPSMLRGSRNLSESTDPDALSTEQVRNITLDEPLMLQKSRKLSASTGLITGEAIRTTNGFVPLVTCEVGTFRPIGSTSIVSGQRLDGCVPCPRGKYGAATGGLISCVKCPRGTFGDQAGYTSVKMCQKCPPNRYGDREGLVSKVCNKKCLSGFYSLTYGNTNIKSCLVCPTTYQGGQCNPPVDPRTKSIGKDFPSVIDRSRIKSVEGLTITNPLPFAPTENPE